ncbi:MAG TPA: TetR/AcrR family transcriptional regulator [Rugosimonospora sp.]|nr:TetR/AcrR family transcriptional regulator [Rugosimonospora sp.]
MTASAGITARQRARAELSSEIKAAARRQLAVAGADGLSLRAVARELGMVSSAIYRYFPSRDDLLTALIIDAYHAMGDAAESAYHAARDPRARWRAVCRAVRDWARAHPREYALLYGSPVPGYHAPPDTVEPATRVARLLLETVRESWAAGTLTPQPDGPQVSARLREQATALAELTAPGLPAPVIARGIVAWTQLYGMISFELFGHLVGSVDPSDDFFQHATEQMADLVGLPRRRTAKTG